MALDITAELIPNTISRFTLGRKIYDSDPASGSAYASTAQNISLALSLSDAIRLSFNGIYSENSYVGMDRTYKLFYIRGSIQYRFSKWGALALGYRYSRRIYSALTGSDYYHHSIDLSYVLIF